MKILHLTKLGAESLLQNRCIPGDFGGGVAATIRDVSKHMDQNCGYKSIITSCHESEFIKWALVHYLYA